MLSTPRLVLREAEPHDATLLAVYQSDPRYLEHYEDPADALSIVETSRRWAVEHPRVNYQLIVILNSCSSVIGCAGLRKAGHPSGEAAIGIELHPDQWGHGYGHEALSRLIEFGRNDLELEHIWAITRPTNQRACRLLHNLGFSPVSSVRQETRFRLSVAAA